MESSVQSGDKLRRTTIQDVAREAGVSPSTVSHVLNGTASISEGTKRRVLDAVETLRYYPNVTARSLRRKHTNIIGLVMQDMTSQFYSIMYERMLMCAQREGYLLTMLCGQWDSDQNAQNIDSLITHQAEGMIVVGRSVRESDLRRAEERDIKVVLCDQYSPNFASVEWNNYTTMRKLVHCFVADGHKRIGYLCTGYRRQDSTEQRFCGYQQGMRDEGLDPERLVFPLDLKESKFFRWGKTCDRFVDFLESISRKDWPEIVLCEHDAIAQAVVYSLTGRGIRIPEELQVVGFDDTSHAFFSTPKLSTVRQDPERLAEETFSMVFDFIRGNEHPRHVCLEQEIVLRESCTIPRDLLAREELRFSQ